jgi:hypothetical protein
MSSACAWTGSASLGWSTSASHPPEIGALFTEDAEYYTAPFRPPWRGREQIVEGWLQRKDEPGETAFEWGPLAITDGLAIIEGTTRYPDQTYSNLWVIRLNADGRCSSFTEWWMEHSTPSTE